ncbi:hypothetical protein C7974DRAFT_141102 [Boeremia exigua]|uniref:uncharacterized protein n=1 Tax=Boeremia exigua TaxID=749465 RepID=UPI001E8CB1E2|nr:uncharacterized protein C7974DRAFT_141102 [Boeremia exigua]KAH6637424.1 hypothetical protein C7974DRAFT_141102 [Boeremia exigua]
MAFCHQSPVAGFSTGTVLRRRGYVSQSSQWEELLPIFNILWPQMTRPRLMEEMEDCYGFRATKDQYKKKFDEWYERGVLPRKNRKSSSAHTKAPKKCVKRKSTKCGSHKFKCRYDQGAAGDVKIGLLTPALTSDDNELPFLEEKAVLLYSAVSTKLEDIKLKTDILYASEHEDVLLQRSCVLGTIPQQSDHHHPNDPWDAWFAANHQDVDEIEVGEAVHKMIELLLDVDFEEERPSCHPNDAQGGFPQQSQSQTGADPEALGDAREKQNDTYLMHVDPPLQSQSVRTVSIHSYMATFCCACNDGPYDARVSVGCAMPECGGHLFCSNCTVECIDREEALRWAYDYDPLISRA